MEPTTAGLTGACYELKAEVRARERDVDELERVKRHLLDRLAIIDDGGAAEEHVTSLGAELEKVRVLLREAPVSPHNAFNSHWLERVSTFLEGSK